MYKYYFFQAAFGYTGFIPHHLTTRKTHIFATKLSMYLLSGWLPLLTSFWDSLPLVFVALALSQWSLNESINLLLASFLVSRQHWKKKNQVPKTNLASIQLWTLELLLYSNRAIETRLNYRWQFQLCPDPVILTGRQMTNLVSNFKHLLLLCF